MQVTVLLQVLLLLTPEQRQLITQVKRGDMIAGDDLARSICDLPEQKRRAELNRVLKRLRKTDNRAKEIAVQGMEACRPKEEPAKVAPDKAASAKDTTDEKAPDRKASGSKASDRETPDRAKPIETTRERAKEDRSVDGERAAAADDVTSDDRPSQGLIVARHRPADEGSGDRDHTREAEPDRRRTRVAVADPADEPPPDLEEIAPAGSEPSFDEPGEPNEPGTPQEKAAPPPPRPTRETDREILRSALTSYGVGGGLVVVSSVGFVVGLAALTVGAIQTAALLDTPEDNDAELTTTWMVAGGVTLLATAAATAELAIGFLLMSSGSDLVDQLSE